MSREDLTPRVQLILEAVEDLNADALDARCYSCKAPMSWGQWLNTSDLKLDVPCHACGEHLISGFSDPVPRATYEEVQEPDYFDRVWYHATTKKDWAQATRKAGAVIHAGNLLAALSRADDLYWENHEGVAEFDLYSFRLRSSKSFTRVLLDDAEVDWQSSMDHPHFMDSAEIVDLQQSPKELVLEPKGIRGAAYYNRYETPGGISILFDASLVQLNSVERRTLKRI